MISRTITHIALASTLIFTLATGFILHASISHEHSHGNEPISPVWDSLHSALRGEDKKLLAAIANSAVSFTYFAILLLILEIGRNLVNLNPSQRKDPDKLSFALQRGVLAYRAFR